MKYIFEYSYDGKAEVVDLPFSAEEIKSKLDNVWINCTDLLKEGDSETFSSLKEAIQSTEDCIITITDKVNGVHHYEFNGVLNKFNFYAPTYNNKNQKIPNNEDLLQKHFDNVMNLKFEIMTEKEREMNFKHQLNILKEKISKVYPVKDDELLFYVRDSLKSRFVYHHGLSEMVIKGLQKSPLSPDFLVVKTELMEATEDFFKNVGTKIKDYIKVELGQTQEKEVGLNSPKMKR